MESTFLTLPEVQKRLAALQNPEWQERASQIIREALKQWRKLHPKATAESPTGQPKPKVPPSRFKTKAIPKATFTGREQDAQGRQVCFQDGHHAPCEKFGGQGQGWQGVEQQYLATQGQKALAPLPDQLQNLQPPTVPPSPYKQPQLFDHQHKAYTPTTGGAKRPKQPHHSYPSDYNVQKPTPASLAPTHKPAEQPQAPPETPVNRRLPANQQALLQEIEQNAGPGHAGTHLAHEIRAHQVDQSVLQQFEAVSAKDLMDLAYTLDKNGSLTGSNLIEFHDDESPFVILSQPQQMLSGSAPISVVVGAPYANQINQLEAAFPGVHFLTVEEAPNQLIQAAGQLAKPLPQLAGVGTKSNSVVDNTNTKLPRQPSHQTIKQDKPEEQKTSKISQQPSSQPASLAKTEASPAPNQQQPKSQAGTDSFAPVPSNLDSGNSPIPNISEVGSELEMYESGPGSGPINYGTTGNFPNAQEYAKWVMRNEWPEQMLNIPEERRLEAQEQFEDKAIDKWQETEWRKRGMDKEPLPRGEVIQRFTTEVGKALGTNPVVESKRLRERASGANTSSLLTLQGGYRGILKLGRGENKNVIISDDDPRLQILDGKYRTGIPLGNMYRREIAFYCAAKAMQAKGFVIPETVLRVVEEGAPGSIQHYVPSFIPANSFDSVGPGLEDAAYGDSLEGLGWAALVDYVLGSIDTNSRNWGRNDRGELVRIDLGMSASTNPRIFDLMELYQITTEHGGGLIGQYVRKGGKIPTLDNNNWKIVEAIYSECNIEDEAIKHIGKRWQIAGNNSGQKFGQLPTYENSRETVAQFLGM